MRDDVTVTVDGQEFVGWKSVRVTRLIDRMVSDFDIGLSERWNGQDIPWPLAPFAPVTIALGGDLILTGYVDDFRANVGARQHSVSITGRSKTEDVIDCTPDVPGGQYDGYTLDRIARAIVGLFGIDVVVQTDMGEAFPVATIQKHETGFAFLERLSRLRGVLMTDDPQGRLVLTRAGSDRAATRLEQGVNLLSMTVALNGAHRWSEYRVKTSVGVAPNLHLKTVDSPEPTPRDETTSQAAQQADAAASADSEPPQTQATTVTSAVAYDAGVPRFRPRTIIAESALDAAGARARADWQARYNAARATQVHVDLAGWRQDGGVLWEMNRIVSIKAPLIKIDQDLLIAGVTFSRSESQDSTRLTLGPVEGYTPDPGQVKHRKAAGGTASAVPVVNINTKPGA